MIVKHPHLAILTWLFMHTYHTSMLSPVNCHSYYVITLRRCGLLVRFTNRSGIKKKSVSNCTFTVALMKLYASCWRPLFYLVMQEDFSLRDNSSPGVITDQRIEWSGTTWSCIGKMHWWSRKKQHKAFWICSGHIIRFNTWRPAFHRRRFKMHFREWECMHFA